MLINHKIMQLGNIISKVNNRENPNQYRVYDKNGISPTIMCYKGGNLQPYIIVKVRKYHDIRK